MDIDKLVLIVINQLHILGTIVCSVIVWEQLGIAFLIPLTGLFLFISFLASCKAYDDILEPCGVGIEW